MCIGSFSSRPVLQCHLGNLDGKYNWKTFKLQLRLIALDQPEYYQDWSIVKHSNVFALCAVCSAAWRIARGRLRGFGGFEKVGILERKQMAHIKSKGPL